MSHYCGVQKDLACSRRERKQHKMEYTNLFLRCDENKFSPTLLDLAPLRPAVCSHMAETEIDRFLTLRKVHMNISEDNND
jgi:hypothetical protein